MKPMKCMIIFIFLTACQGSNVSNTPKVAIQTKTLSPVPTITPLPPSPTTVPSTPTSMQMPLERLAFMVATNVGGMYPDTIIAFAKSDGTGLEFPSLFEPFRDTGGVTGKHLVWSPDGRYLAFDGADQIFDCAGQTSGDCFATNYGTFLVDFSQDAIIEHVESTLTNSSWSPDSQNLVLSIDEKQSSGSKSYIGDLYILNVTSGQKTQLTDHPTNDLYPSWSPDGQWIAFIRFTPGPKLCTTLPSTGSIDECDNGSLYLIRPDGSDLRLLLEPVHIEAPVDGRHRPYNAPAWSPDSHWLAIMVEKEGLPSLINQEIALVNIETGELRRLTDNLVWDVFPTWSPDGARLAFVSGRDGNDEIYVMNADGTNPINLTNDPGIDYAPAWSPSGNYIAFMSSRGIYTMKADGTNLTRINDDYFSVITRPSWFPSGRP